MDRAESSNRRRCRGGVEVESVGEEGLSTGAANISSFDKGQLIEISESEKWLRHITVGMREKSKRMTHECGHRTFVEVSYSVKEPTVLVSTTYSLHPLDY